jgi:hypothetical protein
MAESKRVSYWPPRFNVGQRVVWNDSDKMNGGVSNEYLTQKYGPGPFRIRDKLFDLYHVEGLGGTLFNCSCFKVAPDGLRLPNLILELETDASQRERQAKDGSPVSSRADDMAEGRVAEAIREIVAKLHKLDSLV